MKKMNLKRNFQVKGVDGADVHLPDHDRLAMLRLVNRVLSMVEANPQEEVSRLIRRNDECPEFQHWSAEEAWLRPVGSKESETVGFVVWIDDKQKTDDLEGADEWSEWPIYRVQIPALAELTRYASS